MGLAASNGPLSCREYGQPELRERGARARVEGGGAPHDFAETMYRLRRRAAAAFMRTKPSGSMDERSLRRTVPVIRFHRRTIRRSMHLVGERECLGR